MSSIAEQDYLSQLYIIQSQNPPSLVLFPETKRIFDIAFLMTIKRKLSTFE